MWVIAIKNSIQTYWPCHRVQLAYSFRLAPVHARMPSALWEGLKPGSEQAWLMLVQSLNPPFFLRHIGAEPGRAKRESRITCMHMLRTPPFFPPNRGIRGKTICYLPAGRSVYWKTMTEVTSFCLKLCGERNRITRHYSAELQTTTQTLRTAKYSIESTYNDSPCHLKVDRDKPALINLRLKCTDRENVDNYR